MSSVPPLVSVITATYNRSRVLHYAVASVLNQTIADWEHLVVGDACTDDSRRVVEAFGDARISFRNLESNFGDQGGPNNEGFRFARGRYIAYLSHDDLYMPGHLEKAVREIENSGADLLFTYGLAIHPGGRNVLQGAPAGERFEPVNMVSASLWLARRELIEEIGPWRHPRECVSPPSQDMILRAWKAGKVFRVLPEVTVILFPAGVRPGVYAKGESEENRIGFERMTREPDFLEKELGSAARAWLSESCDLAVGRHFRRGAINLVKRAARRFGSTPLETAYFLSFRRKGRFINRWRKKGGLDEIE